MRGNVIIGLIILITTLFSAGLALYGVFSGNTIFIYSVYIGAVVMGLTVFLGNIIWNLPFSNKNFFVKNQETKKDEMYINYKNENRITNLLIFLVIGLIILFNCILLLSIPFDIFLFVYLFLFSTTLIIGILIILSYLGYNEK